jgi:hypothetical protein
LSIKAKVPLGEEIAAPRSSSYCGIPFCRHIGGRLLVAGIGTGPVAWERCLRADRKKRGGTCHRLRTAPYLALLWLALYNTGVQTLFPLRKHIIWNFAWRCFRCAYIFFQMRNNLTGYVYCLRAQNRASASRWSSIVLLYLGPEIIAVIKAGSSIVPSDSRSGPGPAFRRGDDKIPPSMVLSSMLSDSNSRTVGVLNVWLHWPPDPSTPSQRI